MDLKELNRVGRAAGEAADGLERIAGSVTGDRARRAWIGAFVLRAVSAWWSGDEGGSFLMRRAEQVVGELPGGAERAVLRRVVEGVESGEATPGLIAHWMVGYAGKLERASRLDEAEHVLRVALVASPSDPEVALHAARIARRRGDRATALERYARVRALDAPCGHFSRLARIGEAMVGADPSRDLGRVIRAAVLSGDGEAAAIGLEERARFRREAGDRAGAIRDLLVALARYTDPVDRARVAHLLADVALARSDPLAAREALLLAVSLGSRAQREHARSRLYSLSRSLGDELGARRWKARRPGGLVSLGAGRMAPRERSDAPAIARWRTWLERRDAQSRTA